MKPLSSSSPDSVRVHTAPAVNERIDQETMRRIWTYATAARGQISQRIYQLEREWDVERVLELNLALASAAGLALGMRRPRGWLLLPVGAIACLLQQAISGWCPLMHLFRRAGVRTRREIEAEKYALKMLRGDFDAIRTVCEDTHLAVEAVRISRGA